jgi:hypothetical protein
MTNFVCDISRKSLPGPGTGGYALWSHFVLTDFLARGLPWLCRVPKPGAAVELAYVTGDDVAKYDDMS